VAKASPLDFVDASLVAASFHRCTMPFAKTSRLEILGAPLVAASFLLCAMPDTNSSLNSSIGASLVLTKCFSNTATSLLLLPYLPLTTQLVHPLWLQHVRFTSAPCLIQTPPIRVHFRDNASCLLNIFYLPSLAMRLDFHIQAPIFSSSSDKYCNSIPPPRPVTAPTVVASYPLAG
jgi:hypothetical protein